ncbi:MAG TPA: GNAT family N-acetyltransferase [Dehalococcoidia bacterium]|jgi:predicted acetyltransferase|nr:GNAT family N-acetyltransferase [Dehalococcoidia bacterium]
MATEIRPARPEEMAEFARVVSLSLAMPAERFHDLRPEWTLCAFEDGRLATAYAAWPFTMRMNGTAMPVAAVTTVSTNPVDRRKGNLRAIMEADFRRRHEQGEALAALYASLAAIYQRYGYAVVTTHQRYAVEPRFLQFAQPQLVSGTLRELHPIELGPLVELYRRFRELRTGYLHRGAPLWHAAVLAPPPPGHTLSAVLYEEHGEALGYVVYTSGPGAETARVRGQALSVRDLVWLTPAAYGALWEHLARFDLVGEVEWPSLPSDDPLPHLLLEPRMLHAETRDGILARIIDVDRAFAGRGYRQEGTLRFAVSDQLCPWNEGCWELEAAPEGASVRRTRGEPAFSAPVSTLAMLLFGQLSSIEAARMGRLELYDERAARAGDLLLRTEYRPFCSDHF